MRGWAKFAAVCALALLGAVSARAQGARYDDIAFRYTPTGALPASGATITVCTSAGTGTPCTPLVPTTPVTLCTDATCTTAGTNPFTADGLGNYGFWALPGKYIVTITGAGLTGYTKTVVLPITLSGNNAFTGNNTHSGTETFSSSLTVTGGGTLSGTFGGNRTDTGANTHSGAETFKNLNNFRFADQFAGADWIAKINAADADLGTTPGTIVVSSSLAGVTAGTALSLSSNHALLFDGGIYSSTVCPVIVNKPGISLTGTPGATIFSCVPSLATTAVFTIDGTGGQAGVTVASARDMIFSGNANVSFGLLLKLVAGGKFDNIRAKNVASACFALQGSLTNNFSMPTCSVNVDTFTTLPTNGMMFDISGAITSNFNFVSAPRMEGLTSGTGLLVTNGVGNAFTGGASQGNLRGLNVVTGKFNSATSIDFEANSTEDILANGGLLLSNVSCNSTTKVHIGSSGSVMLFGAGPAGGSNCTPTTVDAGGAFIDGTSGAVPASAQSRFVIDTGTQTLSGKMLNVPLPSGTGLQIFNTTTTCTTAASVGATCTTAAISLPVAEADTAYRLACTGKGVTNVPVVIATTNSSATQFTITIAALTAAAASFSSYDCVAGHN